MVKVDCMLLEKRVLQLMLLVFPLLAVDLNGTFVGVSDIVIPILVLLSLAFGAKIVVSPYFLWPLAFIAVSFISVCVAATFGSQQPEILVNFFRLVSIFSIIVVAAKAASNSTVDVVSIVWPLFCGLFAACLLGIVLDAFGVQVREEQQKMWLGGGETPVLRAGGILGNTAAYGHHIALLFSFSVYLMFKCPQREKWLLLLAIGAASYALIVSSSRAALVNMLAFSIAFLCMYKGLRASIYLVAFGIVFSVAAYITFSSSLDESILQYSLSRIGLGGIGLEQLSANRLRNWPFYLGVVGDNILFGVGYKQALVSYGLQVDNSFLSVGLELGIFSLVAFTLMWVSWFFFGITSYLEARGSIDHSFFAAFAFANFVHAITLDIYTLWISFPVVLVTIFFLILRSEHIDEKERLLVVRDPSEQFGKAE